MAKPRAEKKAPTPAPPAKPATSRPVLWALVGLLLAAGVWLGWHARDDRAPPTPAEPAEPAEPAGAPPEGRAMQVSFRLPPVHKIPEDPQNGEDAEKRAAVREAFTQSWDAYARHAWGLDEFHPLSQSGSNLLGEGRPLGYTIVDTLDTLILLHEDEGYARARDWVRDELDWAIDGRLNVFETTIRMLGGLLSASALIADPPTGALPASAADAAMFLAKAQALADRLLPAFATPTGIPLREVNLATGEAFPDQDNHNASSLAEATTIQLEFKYLAHLTNNATYWATAERPMHYARQTSLPPSLGILPIFLRYVFSSDAARKKGSFT